MTEAPTKRAFLRNNDSGECGFYCGSLSDKPGVLKAIGHMIDADMEEMEHGTIESIDYSLYVELMTDAEVEALPDM